MGQVSKAGGLATLVWAAQGRVCPICGETLEPALRGQPDTERASWSWEHVWPRRFGFARLGNQLITHKRCNNGKADREPTACEIIMLHAVNAQLGFSLRVRSPPSPAPAPLVRYRDQISGPGVLALAFQRASLG